MQIDVVQRISCKIEDWWTAVPVSLRTSADLLPSTPQHTLPLILLLRVIYHQSVSVLHSSLVPLFSCRTTKENLKYARQISAQLSYEHASSISMLLKAVLSHSVDTDRLPSFIGYAAYSASAVLIPFFWCLDQHVQDQVRSNVLANLRIIQQMGKQWRFIALLVSPNLLFISFHR